AIKSLWDGISGQANLDRDAGDDRIDLQEWVNFLAARYQRLPRDPGLAPRPVLMRGGDGRLDSADAAADVWLAWDDGPPVEEQQDASDEDAAPEGAASNVEESITQNGTLEIRNVRFSPLQEANGSTDTGDVDDAETPADTDAATNTDDGASDASSGVAASASAAGQPSFWDLRDALEDARRTGQLTPVGLVPHLWRDLNRWAVCDAILQPLKQPNASVAQAESTPGRSREAPAVQRLNEAVSQLVAIRQAITDEATLPEVQSLIEPLGGIRSAWSDHVRVRRQSGADAQVLAADRLQQLVAVARSRLWAWVCFQREAIPVAADGMVSPPEDLFAKAESSERTLLDAQGAMVDRQELVDAADRMRQAILSFNQSVAAAVEQLGNEFGVAMPADSWHCIRRADAFLHSPLPSGPDRRRLRQWIAAAKPDASDRDPVPIRKGGYPLSTLVERDSVRLSLETLARWECRLISFADQDCWVGPDSHRTLLATAASLRSPEADSGLEMLSVAFR
ncbi:MAG: hypothetical protein AAGA03_20575, partial [Planctomycetota bacterium]